MSLINIIPTSPILNIDVTAISKVVLLPAASTCLGATFQIRDWKAACCLTTSIYLSTVGLDRVDGVSLSTTQLQMTSSLEIVKIMSLGNTAWSIVGRNKTIASTLGISILPYISPPLLSIISFSFVGIAGTTDARPTLIWSNSGATVVNYSLDVYGDTNPTPTTVITTITNISPQQTSYYYTPTVSNYYYKYVLTATNTSPINSIVTTSILLNVPT